MTSHFKWYPSSEEVVIPWNARYQFPSQANKSTKITPRIPPKNGAIFTPGNVIRLEFPAQGYVNPANTTLVFDVAMFPFGAQNSAALRFQNNIQSLFTRVRLLYGAAPLEDIINYNVIVRMLTEWSATNHNGSVDQTSIAEGIGGTHFGNTGDKKVYASLVNTADGGATTFPTATIIGVAGNKGLVNVRQTLIQGFGGSAGALHEGFEAVPNSVTEGLPNGAGGPASVRRYQVQFLLGLFTQDKLIPTKFMASQLAIEITLATAEQCMFVEPGDTSLTAATGTLPTYTLFNINLLPEILEFDASYDSMFLSGLRQGGVPLKFSSWHTFIFSVGGQTNINLQIQERSRSVKSLFAVQRRGTPNIVTDGGALFYNTQNIANGAGGNETQHPSQTLQNYQYRIGGRYFPAQPVQCSTQVGSSVSNGGAEAYLELMKALNVVGDYRLSTSVNPLSWAMPYNVVDQTVGAGLVGPILNMVPGNTLTYATIGIGELDYSADLYAWNDGLNTGCVPRAHLASVIEIVNGGSGGLGFAGSLPSSAFAMAINLETSNGLEISGLNAEEQSDISLIANYSSAQATTSIMEVYTFFDAMIILRENNVLELIQ